MLIGINNSVLYIDYLHNLTPKKNVLHNNGKGKAYAKKIKIYIGSGCRVGL